MHVCICMCIIYVHTFNLYVYVCVIVCMNFDMYSDNKQQMSPLNHKSNFTSTAHTSTCCIWVGTDKGNVIMMTVHVKSSSTEDQPRTVELTPSGNVTIYSPTYVL